MFMIERLTHGKGETTLHYKMSKKSEYIYFIDKYIIDRIKMFGCPLHAKLIYHK